MTDVHDRFRPVPADVRCAGTIYRAGWEFGAGRCPQRHLAGSDLCRRHRLMELAGQVVQRVRAPRRETA